jgi:DNA polymerase I-like protein with 3'-5' exonuclease and polymerase domains
VVTSFGQGHLNAVNPKTDRIHTVYRQLGAASGRMSCGSQQPNSDLAKIKQIRPSECTYPNIQQLPSDEVTRACFTAPEGYLWSSCDYSALESRLGADIYNESAMIDEYLHGSGDIHSLVAKFCFPKELEGIDVKDIKKLRPDLRKKAKGPEFAMQFGGSPFAIQGALACSIEEAEQIAEDYWNGFKGIADFKKKGSDFVRKHGYILMCQYSGHKMFWWDHDKWLERQKSFTQDFWEEYRTKHKGTGDAIAQEVSMHFRAASKWDRMALNSVTQGSGIVILKIAMTDFFNWIVDNGYFKTVELSALVHDEANIIYPKELHNIVTVKLQKCMEKAASIVCTKVPIPAEPAINDHWEH